MGRKEIVPISIERLNGEFLLHYSEYSFFVNRHGWRARPDWLICWEGRPQTFALSHPYLLAFEPSFIEIRNLESSALVHIVTAKNIRMLHSSTREVSIALTLPLYGGLRHRCANESSDPVCIRRGKWRRYCRQPGFLEQTHASTEITSLISLSLHHSSENKRSTAFGGWGHASIVGVLFFPETQTVF